MYLCTLQWLECSHVCELAQLVFQVLSVGRLQNKTWLAWNPLDMLMLGNRQIIKFLGNWEKIIITTMTILYQRFPFARESLTERWQISPKQVKQIQFLLRVASAPSSAEHQICTHLRCIIYYKEEVTRGSCSMMSLKLQMMSLVRWSCHRITMSGSPDQ